MKFEQAKVVYRVVRDHRSRSLDHLRSLPSGVLVATGAGLAVHSFDEGRSWQGFGAGCFDGENILEIAEHDGCVVVFTRGEENQVRIWKGGLEPDRWIHTTDLWGGWLDYAAVTSGNTLIAAVRDQDSLNVFSSSDLGPPWKLSLRLKTSGSLNLFRVNTSGIAIAVLLNDTEMFDESDFECTVIAMDVLSRRVVDRRTFRGNVQSAFSSGEHTWLFGANSGLLFSYDSATHDLQTRAVLEDAELNITGIHMDQGKLVLVAEESDPPGKVWLLYENGAAKWSSFRTGIECYVYGTASVRNGIVVLADNIYTIDLVQSERSAGG